MKNIPLPLLLLALAACSSPLPPKGVKVGKPYMIGWTTYYPEYDPTYDERGLASWYGPGFHGSSTANGEKFDTHDLTAAHPTLPMPSIVRVTNLENGKTLVVRINDRGPFARGRIIDLSKASAQRLGITGLAKVRVQYLKPESEQYIAAVAEGRRIDMFAVNEQIETHKTNSILAATAPSDQSFIIESNHNETTASDVVVGAAPIVSVANADLPDKGKKKSGGFLIREAYAEEEVGNEVVLRVPGEAPQPQIPSQSQPASERENVNASGIYIQVGSFGAQANAHKMQSAVSGIAPVQVTNVEVSGHEWWRVRAGPFGSDDAAAEALERIRQCGAADARIVRQ